MLIKSKDYFNSKVNNERNYSIIVVKTKNDIIEMISYFEKFIKLDGGKKYASLDFEFNSSPDGKKQQYFRLIQKMIMMKVRFIYFIHQI